MRPLSIFSVLYRLWAGVRYQHLAAWQESWAVASLHGGRANHEATEATWDITADIEEAHLTKTPLLGALFDYSKFFDLIIRDILWPLALAFGCPKEVINAA